MRRFQFRLESVLNWRKTQLELEEDKLERLFAEQRRIEESLASLEQDRAAAGRQVLDAPVVEATQLQALEEHRAHLARRKQLLLAERGGCAQRIQTQRGCVLKAERNLRLLENLKERRLEEWRAETDREQEALAGEAFLAQWHRRS